MSDQDATPEPGAITITVTVPDGLPVPRATAWMYPDTEAQFERALELLGGITASRSINTDFASFAVPGGEVFLYWPKDLAAPTRARTPQEMFADGLRDRKTAAADLLAKLEDSYGAKA